MSDNFWDRDYVIEHLRVCPNDYEFLERLESMCISCQRLRSAEEVMYLTCYECSTEAALRG